ncbi:hypothetical protein VXG46_000714 [Acinetobacter baumannii]|nr:hypothetical protein [Acinetobacter baumannii]EMC7949345.1 hypothetical protein [Acinetobacter baumannii]EMD9691604.1 hypothetical protein [Acinetobacter baumannii]
MTDISKKKSLFDATFSWNGYIYQGNVGLYVCLFEIEKKLKSNKSVEDSLNYLYEYSIEYEWLEDFSIKVKDKYLSLHQVKNYSSDKIEDYIEAIETILNRKTKIISVNDLKSYLQIKKPKKSDKNYIDNKIKDVFKKLIEIKCIDSNHKFNDTYNLQDFDVVDIKKEYVEDFFKEFKDFTDNAFNETSIYLHSSEKIKTPEKTYENYSISNIHNKSISGLKTLSNLKIYMNFDTGVDYSLNLSDNELDKKNKELIGSIINEIHGPNILEEIDIDIYYFALQEHVRKNIQQRHIDIKNKLNEGVSLYKCEKKSINFKFFIDTLSEKFISQNENYWKIYCRKKFKKSYDDHMGILLDALENDENDEKDLIEKYINNIEIIASHEFDEIINNDPIGFLQKISCDVLRSDNERFYEELGESDKITQNFFSLIQEIEKIDPKIQYKCKKLKAYQPTSMSFRDNQSSLIMSRQYKAIQKININYDSKFIDLSKTDYLIVNVPSKFENRFDNVPVRIPSIIEGELPSEDLITEDKFVKFISHTKAIKELS